MAQVLDYFTGTVNGTPAYIYARADDTSAAVRVYTGDGLIFYPNANKTGPELSGQYYHVATDGSLSRQRGWIKYYFTTNISDHWKTVTDKLRAPTLSLNKDMAVLTLSGGQNGDLNTFNAYRYQYRERVKGSGGEWGAWSTEQSISASVSAATKTLAVTCGEGMERQYRARCAGTAGSGYYSDYTVCTTIYYEEPVGSVGDVNILYPQDGSTHVGRGNALIVLHIGDSTDYVKLQYSVDGGAWVTDTFRHSAAAKDISLRLSLTAGDHTIGIRGSLSSDPNVTGNPDSVPFTHAPVEYAREISAGSVIANESISHVAELNQMLELVNRVRAAAGLSEIAYTEAPGRFANWHDNVQQLKDALTEARTASGGGFTVTPPTVPADPTKSGAAAALETVRDMIDEF